MYRYYYNSAGGWQVLKELDFSKIAEEFITQLNELQKVLLVRLLTTPLEVLQRKEYIEDVQNNTAKVEALTEIMQQDLAELTAEKEQQVFMSSGASFSKGPKLKLSFEVFLHRKIVGKPRTVCDSPKFIHKKF